MEMVADGKGCGLDVNSCYEPDNILGNPATYQKGGVYYYSERGGQLIDLNAFRDTLWQKCNLDNPQLSSFGSEVKLNE
ncbi:hypothetical protein L6452_03394 [Arctium lappa]|uniref:Uncharacterized protein n=1 Tax=Arctium lappa TaxID=4217 RepID=A0ACB9FMP0_ARCLA|nr:hypothetical protein L6452_03394 [Arctium lappa]